jgi:hypothetical protein
MTDTTHETGREARAGRNQSLFREVNERLQESSGVLQSEIWPESFFCECAHETCFEPISLTPEEYEAVRKDPRTFFVAPSDAHYIPAVERIVKKTEHFWVVEKIGQDAAVAEKFDPRARPSSRSIQYQPRP